MNTPNDDSMICECFGTVKKLTTVGGCSEDLVAVSTLPDSWVPQHCSPTLTEYLKEREQNHNKVLEELFQDASRVNRDVDAKVRTIAEILLSDIEGSQNDIECVVQKSKPDEGMLSADDRNKALEEITRLFTQRIEDFVKFKQETLELERQRADGIRSVFKTHFQSLIAIGHKTPKDLLHEFDDRIYEVNQQLLSNVRAYIELESQLKLQLDNSMANARSALNQMCLTKSKSIKSRSVLPWMRISESSDKIFDSADKKKIKEQNFLSNLEDFKFCVSQILNTYRNAIPKLFTEFSYRFVDLYKDYNHREVDRTRKPGVTIELKNIIDDALEQITDTNVQIKEFVYKDLEEMAQTDVQHLHSAVSTLGKIFLDTYMILFDTSHMWNDHILRSVLVQKLIVAAVEDLQNIHDTIELANEMSFNITLELLRYAPDVDKLQHNCDLAMNLLKQTEDMNQNHGNSEIAKLEEYMNLPSIMANVFLSDCNVFLENRPKIIVEPSKNLTNLAGFEYFNSKSVLTFSAHLPRAILQANLQEMVLNKCKNDFMSSLEYNLSTMSEELNRQARKWIDERSVQLNIRHSLKRMSHGIRAERVTAAREARLAELCFHEDRLNSHLEAMYDRIDRLPLDASSYLSLEAAELYPFCKWIQSIQTDMDLLSTNPDPEVKRLKMLSYAPRLVKHRELFQDSLDLAIDEYRYIIQHMIQVARISNFNFMSQLKLFMEGGRYAAVEATKTCASLVKAADALEVCFNRSMDALNARRVQLLALADQQMLPLQRALDEVIKFPKNDKKKPPLHKK